MNKHFLRNGLISRNLMDVMAFCPPLIITAPQVCEILSVVEQSLEGLAAEMA